MLRLVIVSPSGELSRTTAAKVSFPGGAKNTASVLRADSSACCATKLKRASR